MSIRSFLPWTDPRLHRPAEPVGEVTEAIRMVWDDMIDTMEAMPGVGRVRAVRLRVARRWGHPPSPAGLVGGLAHDLPRRRTTRSSRWTTSRS